MEHTTAGGIGETASDANSHPGLEYRRPHRRLATLGHFDSGLRLGMVGRVYRGILAKVLRYDIRDGLVRSNSFPDTDRLKNGSSVPAAIFINTSLCLIGASYLREPLVEAQALSSLPAAALLSMCKQGLQGLKVVIDQALHLTPSASTEWNTRAARLEPDTFDDGASFADKYQPACYEHYAAPLPSPFADPASYELPASQQPSDYQSLIEHAIFEEYPGANQRDSIDQYLIPEPLSPLQCKPQLECINIPSSQDASCEQLSSTSLVLEPSSEIITMQKLHYSESDTLKQIDGFLVTDGKTQPRITLKKSLSLADRKRGLEVLRHYLDTDVKPGVYLWRTTD